MKLTVPQVLPLIKAYIDKPGNSMGGSLHIVLADENIADRHIQFCKKWAEERSDYDGVVIADHMLTMSKTQRRQLAAVAWIHTHPI